MLKVIEADITQKKLRLKLSELFQLWTAVLWNITSCTTEEILLVIEFQPTGSTNLKWCSHWSFRCYSYVGRSNENEQIVNLQPNVCTTKGITMHEFIHVLGFDHEQVRSDRDKYIRLISENSYYWPRQSNH